MKFTIETKQIARALSAVGVAADSRLALPILGSVMIEAKDGTVLLSATNLDIYATEKVTAETKEPGAVVVAFRTLSQFLNREGSQKTTFETKENEVVVTCGESEARLETLPAEEFPPNLRIEETTVLEVETKELLGPLQDVVHAVSTEESSYILMGVCVRSKPQGLDFVATNRGRLAMRKTDIPAAEGMEAVLPTEAVKAILKNITQDQCRMVFGSGVFAITSGDSEVRGKLIEGTYPQYENVIPKPSKTTFSVMRKELIEAITSAALFLKQNEIRVTLTGKGKEVEVSCFNRYRQNLLGSELAGQPDTQISFDHRFMREALSVLTGETVRIEVCNERFSMIREGSFTALVGLLVTPKG